MPLQWVLFNLTGTLVDPTVLAQPLGDSGADEELVLSALDDAVAMAMVDALTGALTPLDELVEAAMRRRLRLAGADEVAGGGGARADGHDAGLPRGAGRAGVAARPRAAARRAGAERGPRDRRGAALRRPARPLRARAQRPGVRRLQARPASLPDGARAHRRRRRRRRASSPPTGGTSPAPSGPACRPAGSPAASARCSTPCRAPDYTGRDLAEAADAIVTKLAA